MAYRPEMDTETWERIEPFVNRIVARAADLTPYNERKLYAVVTPLAAWMRTRAGLPLESEIALDPHIIDRFVMEGLAHYTKAGRGTMRSRLRRLSETLEPALGEPARERPLGKSPRSSPYSRLEVADLAAWAHALPSHVRVNAERLLALGFGAGLIGTEFGRVRAHDLQLLQPGILVHVTGERPRSVPVLAEWEHALVLCKNSTADNGYVFRVGRQTTHRNVITNFVERHTPPIPLQARRLRATWVTRHLSAGTPVPLLLSAAGLSSAEGLDPFLPFADVDVDAAATLRLPRIELS